MNENSKKKNSKTENFKNENVINGRKKDLRMRIS